ncbi:nitrilase-related carbon-nitrogen hydrolase [Nonomuraea sp. JJY05]|uniref:nitrilase-related carbon-nitrogen hydrolase n=1 Tax=Nonomuraea sp. JJY05 TaxID=3350255 RepID=UPI00373F57A1
MKVRDRTGSPLSAPSRPIRIAAAQAQAEAGDIEANAATVAAMVHDAAQAEAGLVVFPEKFLSGYEPDLILQLDGRRLGLGICYDSGFPSTHARRRWTAARGGRHRSPELITADLDPQVLLATRDSEPMLRDLHGTTTDARAYHRLA